MGLPRLWNVRQKFLPDVVWKLRFYLWSTVVDKHLLGKPSNEKVP